ncbi:DNA cytosine methyltransferase [Hoeflea sp.]|uniref:DNA cytosine methyltransferase n=1 Tax=Hoeflea sp. TaxID=1940281 RepID=UPI003BAFB589
MAIHPEHGPPLTGLALCAGVGGLELGLHIAEPRYRTVCFVEREAFAAATLVARMADKALDHAPVWDDVKAFDGRPWRGKVSLVTGGYPCQPFSAAGLQRGKNDPRHLWPDIARIVREVDP